MKHIFMFFTYIIVFISMPIFSQTTDYRDRFAAIRDLINSNELIMIWGEGPSQNDQTIHQRIYDLDLTQPGLDTRLAQKPIQFDSLISGNKRLTVATGNFLGGKYKHLVTAWAAPGDSISINVPQIEAGTLSWASASRISVPGLSPFGANRKIKLGAGDFYGNRQDEFVLAYSGADSTIHLQLFDFNPGSLDPQPQGSINDEQLMLPGTNLDNWDIVTGDFDSDGYTDVALLFVKPLAGSNWSLYAKIYTIDDQGNFLARASQEVFQRPQYSVTQVNIAGASGALDGDTEHELAFGFCFSQQESGPDTYVYLLDIRNSLATITVRDTSRIERDELNDSDIEPLDIAIGDLNGNNRDEIVLMVGTNFSVYSSNNQLQPQFEDQRSVSVTGVNDHSDAFLAVGDMDLDQRSEIVIAKSEPGSGDPGAMQHFEIEVISIDSMLTTFTTKARRSNEMPILADNGFRHYAIALGDFDADRVRLGEPVHTSRTGIMQPSVILYTPPVHYDIFDTTIVDLSGCYPGQSCGFSSSYVQSTTIDTTVEVEIHEDWGGDASSSFSLEAIKVKVTATYGNKFSNKSTSSRSQTITIGRVAEGDDWIYANVYDIDFYEYPVYDSLDTVLGYFLVSIPGDLRPIWIENKDESVLGNMFRADHEVGNILSYKTENTFDTSSVIVNFPEQTIGSTGASFVSLQMNSFQQNNAETSWDGGLSVGVTTGLSADIYGIEIGAEVEVNGRYNYGEITTQTVSVGNSIEMRADFGNLQPQFGTSGTYYINPYSYWTSYGALALDYKVSPLPTASGTIWEQRYGGKVDLAFSLPWRYDAEKGYPFPGNDASYRIRSRDIVLSKSEPAGGDTVTIGARIRNLGLQDITSPVTVRFYDGDPASGGTLIEETIMDTTIAARESQNVFISWIIPLNQPLFTTRIYVEIDPDNNFTNEVHENNNVGWAPAVAIGVPTSVGTVAKPPSGFVLYQSYPNPFNPTTTIRFNIFTAQHVSLKIFNVLGQEVVTLIDDVRSAGDHRVEFNAGGLASGVYYYRLQADDLSQTKRLVLLR